MSRTPPSRGPGPRSARGAVPPAQDAQRPQRHPARRLARPVVDVEPDPARERPVERPRPVARAPGADVLDRVAEPRVGCGAGQLAGGAEVVEGAQHVVAPAVRMQERQEPLVGLLARAETTEEPALQEVLLAGP